MGEIYVIWMPLLCYYWVLAEEERPDTENFSGEWFCFPDKIITGRDSV